MQFVDTHCHIHFDYYSLPIEQVIQSARDDGVTKMICVGCTFEDSKSGIEFIANHDNIWASIGIHPHEADKYVGNQSKLDEFAALVTAPKVVAVGECGLDYYYNHSDQQAQKEILRFQIKLAKKHDLPMIFHVRDAHDDFFEVLDEFEGIRGVVHSFSAGIKELTGVIDRGLFVGLNGIMTFTKDSAQLAAAKLVPLDKMVLETDAPYLTPKPFRGTMCEPKHVVETARFLAELRGESLEELSKQTTANAERLFGI